MQRLVAGEKWADYDLVFPNLVGRPLQPTNVVRALKAALKKAGLPAIRFHDLRHTNATLLLLMNVHPKIVSERLGHSDVRITLNLYSHAIPSLQAEAALQMDMLLEKPQAVDLHQTANALDDFEKGISTSL